MNEHTAVHSPEFGSESDVNPVVDFTGGSYGCSSRIHPTLLSTCCSRIPPKYRLAGVLEKNQITGRLKLSYASEQVFQRRVCCVCMFSSFIPQPPGYNACSNNICIDSHHRRKTAVAVKVRNTLEPAPRDTFRCCAQGLAYPRLAGWRVSSVFVMSTYACDHMSKGSDCSKFQFERVESVDTTEASEARTANICEFMSDN